MNGAELGVDDLTCLVCASKQFNSPSDHRCWIGHVLHVAI